MKKRLLFALLVIAPAAPLLHADDGPGAPFRILTTSHPLHLMALNVAGRSRGVEVACLGAAAPGGRGDLPSPAAADELSRASVLVAHGAGIEPYLDGIAVRFPRLPIVELAEGIDAPEGKGAVNSFIWMSAADTVREAKRLKKALKRIDPARSERYERNGERYVARLEALRDRIRGLLNPFRGETVVARDGASARFAREEGLRVLAAPSPAEAVSMVRASDAQAVLVPAGTPEDQAHRLARETGRTVCAVDILSSGPADPNAYLSAMEGNAKALREALRRRP